MNVNELNGVMTALQNQRNAAFNECAQAAGAIAILNAQVAELQAENEKLKAQIPKDNEAPAAPDKVE